MAKWTNVNEALPENGVMNLYVIQTAVGSYFVVKYHDGFRYQTAIDEAIPFKIAAWTPVTEDGWILTKDRTPDKDGKYLGVSSVGNVFVLSYADGFNCYRINDEVHRENEIAIFAWKPIPTLDHDTCRPFKFSSTKGMVDHIINSLESDNNCEQDYCSQGIMDDLYELKEMMEVGR